MSRAHWPLRLLASGMGGLVTVGLSLTAISLAEASESAADTVAPSAPTLDVMAYDDLCTWQYHVNGDESVDNIDSGSQLTYELYLDGELVASSPGSDHEHVDSYLITDPNLSPGTYTVRARDQAGNLSAPSNPYEYDGFAFSDEYH